MENIKSYRTMKKCPVCYNFLFLSKEIKRAADGTEYFSEKCMKIDYYRNLKETTYKEPEPEFLTLDEDDLYKVLSEDHQVKSLNYSTENHLFYSMIQILGYLDHSKIAVFQEGWEKYYRQRITRLKSLPKESKKFAQIITAFNRYMKELWDPSTRKVTTKSETGLVKINHFFLTEIKGTSLRTILTELSKHLNYLSPVPTNPPTALSETEPINETRIDHDQDSEEDGDDSDLSYLNWLYFDLTQKLGKKNLKVKYYTKGGELKEIDVQVPLLLEKDQQDTVTFGIVANAARARIPELRKREYWITNHSENRIELLYPHQKIDLSKEDYMLYIWRRSVFTKADDQEVIDEDRVGAVIKFGLIFHLEGKNSSEITTKTIPFIFLANLSGKLGKLKSEFSESLKNFITCFFPKTKDNSDDSQGMFSSPSLLSKSDISSSNSNFVPKGRVRILVDRYCAEVDWEKQITSLIRLNKKIGANHLIEIEGLEINYSITEGFRFRNLETMKVEVVEEDQFFEDESKFTLNCSNIVGRTSESNSQPILPLLPEEVTCEFFWEDFKNLVKSLEDKEEGEAVTHPSMLVYKVGLDFSRHIFMKGKTFGSARMDMFGGEFELKAIIHNESPGYFYSTIVLKEFENDERDSKIGRDGEAKVGSKQIPAEKKTVKKEFFDEEEIGEDREKEIAHKVLSHFEKGEGRESPGKIRFSSSVSAVGSRSQQDAQSEGNHSEEEEKTYFYKLLAGVAERLTGDSICKDPVYFIYVRKE